MKSIDGIRVGRSGQLGTATARAWRAKILTPQKDWCDAVVCSMRMEYWDLHARELCVELPLSR
jgi:hypothetical protein